MNFLRFLAIALLAFAPIQAGEPLRKVTVERTQQGGTNIFVQLPDNTVVEFKGLDSKGRPVEWIQKFTDTHGRALVEIYRMPFRKENVQPRDGIFYIFHHHYNDDGSLASTVEFFGDGRIRRRVVYRYNDKGTLLGGEVFKEKKRIEWLNDAAFGDGKADAFPALTEQQHRTLEEWTAKLKTGNSVSDIDNLKDSLKRWDELMINPAPADLKPVFAALKPRVKERIAELETETKLLR